MSYNPHIHHRRSIRLNGYDYSREGFYFITICVKDRVCLYGKISNGKTVGETVGETLRGFPSMILNDAGKMIERWYNELENKYPDKFCHEMIVMPNHFHCIIENTVQATPCDRPDNAATMDAHTATMGAHVGAPLRGHPNNNERSNNDEHPETPYGPENKKYNATIGDAMDWFKTITTNEYIRGVKTLGWEPFNGKLWQRNYWEHIIRDEQSYQRISDYIINNPAKWADDKFYKE